MSTDAHPDADNGTQRHPSDSQEAAALITEHSAEPRPISRLRDLACTAVCLLAAAVVFLNLEAITDRGTGLSALNGRFWPTALATALIITGISIALVALLKKTRPVTDQEPIAALGIIRLGAAIILLAAYVASWGTIQFALSTAVVTGALTYLFGGRNSVSWLFFPLGLGLLFHLFFIVLLKVPIQ